MDPEMEKEQLEDDDVEETKEAGAEGSDQEVGNSDEQEDDDSSSSGVEDVGETETELTWRLKREARLAKKEAREAEKDDGAKQEKGKKLGVNMEYVKLKARRQHLAQRNK